MSKMKSFQVIALTLSMLMIISMVKGRRLDLETYSTSMTSVGVHNISNDNPPNQRLEISNSSTFYAEKRCKSLYGFFPCADTMLESVFLIFMYMYFMILGEELMSIGSKVLFQWIGDKKFGESVFGVLKALPRIAVFVVPGVLSPASDAQNQVAFGVSMYAGTTVITLTLIWGIRIILSIYERKKRSSRESDLQQDSSSRHNLKKGSSRESDQQQDSSSRQNPKKGSSCESDNQQDSLTKCLSLLTDTGVNIDKETGDMAVTMLCSLIPFAFVGLLHFINTPAMTLLKLIVSVASLLLYFRYQVKNSWIRFRSLAYLKQENLRARFFNHVICLSEFEDVFDKQGNFDVTCFKRIFDEADKNKDKQISNNVDNNKDEHISHNVDNNGDHRISYDELGDLVQKMFMLKEKDEESKESAKESAKAAILIHFDRNKNKQISWEEFKSGCTNWIEEAISSGSVFENIWKYAKTINKQRSNLRLIDKKMLKILEQVLKKHGRMKEYGKPDEGDIEWLYSKLLSDNDDKVLVEKKEFADGKPDEGEIEGNDEFIKTHSGKALLDHDDKVLEESEEEKEFLDGFIKWVEKARDPKKAIEKCEEDWRQIHTLLKPEKSKATIVYAIFGIAITITITSPFIASVRQFSTAAHIPFLLTSFVMAPIAMKAKIVIVALFNVQPRVQKNPSLTFSEIYDQLVMDNLIGFASLLVVVYIRGLSWTYSAEVVAIVIPCAIVGVFAIKRDTYPLWASISAILLYPVSVYIYYVLPNAS